MLCQSRLILMLVDYNISFDSLYLKLLMYVYTVEMLAEPHNCNGGVGKKMIFFSTFPY